MRLIVQPVTGGFELCARLGLVLVPAHVFGLNSKAVHAVLDDSPSARAGIVSRDIIIAVDNAPWNSVRRLTFSDRRPSEITLKTFVARYFSFTNIMVRVPPEPYQLLDEIATEAANIIAARPTPDRTPYRNPRFDDMRELLARFSSRRGCRR
jgi:membrane-associated protease RseP (regulator of RpoE activity)